MKQAYVQHPNRYYSAIDARGKEIKIGDFFCYTAAAGRSAVMKFGKVTGIKEHTEEQPCKVQAITVDLWPADGLHEERIKNRQEIEWVKKEIAEGRYLADRFELQNNGKPITIGMTGRIMVLPPSLLPDKAYEILCTQ